MTREIFEATTAASGKLTNACLAHLPAGAMSWKDQAAQTAPE